MSDSTKKRGLALLAHGSKDPRWKTPFEQIAARLAARMPEEAVGVGYLQYCGPTIFETVAAMAGDGVGEVTVVPMLLAAGSHARDDYPRIVDQLRAAHPGVTFVCAEVFGEWDEAQDAIAGLLAGRFG